LEEAVSDGLLVGLENVFSDGAELVGSCVDELLDLLGSNLCGFRIRGFRGRVAQ
jgi:hypothetical protein